MNPLLAAGALMVMGTLLLSSNHAVYRESGKGKADAGYHLPPLLPDGGSPFFATANPFEFARFKGRLPDRMGGQSIVGSVPTWIGQMHLHEPPEEVRGYYRAKLKALGMPPVEGMPSGSQGELYLTFADPRTQQTCTITLVPQEHGDSVMVLASVSNATNYKPYGADQVPPEFPMPSDSKGVSFSQITDGDLIQRNIGFRVPGKPEDVLAFFDREMGQRGFQQLPGAVTRSLGKWGRTYSRKQEQVMMSIDRGPDDDSTHVSAIWIQR